MALELSYTGNLFNSALNILNTEITGTGQPTVDSTCSISAPIYVGHLAGRLVHISGLHPPGLNWYNFVVFYNAKPCNAASRVDSAAIPQTETAKTVVIPKCLWMVITTRARSPTVPVYSNIQVNLGNKRTDENLPVPIYSHESGIPLAGYQPTDDIWANKIVATIGDSITRDNAINPSASPGVYLVPNPAGNWPAWATRLLSAKAYYTAAIGGATIAKYPGNITPFHSLVGQAAQLIAYFKTNSIVPDIVIIAGGTNDVDKSFDQPAGYGGFGTFLTAQSKKLISFDANGLYNATGPTALDLSKTAEALRAIQLMWLNAFSDIQLYYSTPLQRTEYYTPVMMKFVQTLSCVAEHNGALVIPSFNTSGIVDGLEPARFLTDEGAPGADGSDVHPNPAGSFEQGTRIANFIKATTKK